MSLVEATAYINRHIASKEPKLAEVLGQDYRTNLNSRTTILDISKQAIKTNFLKEGNVELTENGGAKFDALYAKLLQNIRSAVNGRVYSSLDEAVGIRGSKLLTLGPILIDAAHPFLVGINFRAIRNIVSAVSNSKELKRTAFGTEAYIDKQGKKAIRSKLDLGHISTANNDNLTSPLEEKLLNLLEYAPANSSLAISTAQALNKLYEIQAEFTYSFKNTAPEAIEKARTILGQGYVVLTIHTATKNNEFSIREGELYRDVVKEIVQTLKITEIPGSNTIEQDLEAGIVGLLKGTKPPKHGIVKGVTKTIKVKPSIIGSSYKQTRLRNEKGHFYSLANLQMLINTHLQDVISANMGDQGYPGGQRQILNYRTGRFAASARVDRMSISREGLVTAFYSYMRNPYQTFSEGGRQQYPKTRDPKLLIGTSIKEIAATKVAARLRAVLI